MVTLNSKEQKKLKIIKEVIAEEKSVKQASMELELSDRQIRRLLVKYKTEGETAFIHKNRGKESNKKISDEEKNRIINLYLEEYSEYNFSHFYEETSEKLDSSYITIFRVLKEEEIISPVAQHKTIKLYNENMKKSIKEGQATDAKINLYQERQEQEKEKHIRKSSILYNYGQEVQMDATFYIWFGEYATALHLAVDKATKKVLYGWFDYEETTEAYMILLMNTILNFGIPLKIKTDKRGSFSINSAKYTKSKLNTTQFGRICKDLEIHLFSSSNPTFKPNVERENRTFKGRLKAELNHENICDIESANRYLNEVFIPKINARFSYEIDENKNSMRENHYTKEDLNIIISERFTRKIDNASAVKFKNDYYIPFDDKTGEVFSYTTKTECTIVVAYDKTLWCYVESNLHNLYKIQSYQELKTTGPSYKSHKPSANHPWAYHKKN